MDTLVALFDGGGGPILIAVLGILLTLIITGFKLAPIFGRWGRRVDDFLGTPERDGAKPRPGVLQRLEHIEANVAELVQQGREALAAAKEAAKIAQHSADIARAAAAKIERIQEEVLPAGGLRAEVTAVQRDTSALRGEIARARIHRQRSPVRAPRRSSDPDTVDYRTMTDDDEEEGAWPV